MDSARDLASPRGEPGAPLVAKLLVEYDGGPYAGWAEQPGARTVAGELRAALRTVLRRDVELTVAGRTDRGVHALGQVASYAGPPPPLRSVNAVLPGSIAVLTAEAAPEGFNARFSARSRSYAYRLLARRAPSPFERARALWWPHRLDEAALHACAGALAGRHDFTAFTPTETAHKSLTRTVLAAGWERTGDVLAFSIEADAFLRHMNRVLVGTMLEVAGGRRSLEDFVALLGGAPRSAAGATAPAHGLYLTGVRY
jgi:tRNA pseudouridine38-40 synthase